MQAVILAGGLGTRISEESQLKPKPMIEIGGQPILWHIMKIYASYGITEFIICLGYKGYMIKEYFLNYTLHFSDVTFDIKNNSVIYHQDISDPWKITLIDTGSETMTGGRIKRIEKYIDDTFCLTYGDGLSDINITNLIDFHKKQSKIATVTAVQPPGRYGALEFDSINTYLVKSFLEKPCGDRAWINGGFFVLEPKIFELIENLDTAIWEDAPLHNLVAMNQLAAYKHSGFWQSMDTMRDKNHLESLWSSDNIPWKSW
jgi:glucose-1-phosphate cytidylyltransferase